MAGEKEMYDYLSAVTPDYTSTTLSLKPREILVEECNKNQIIHIGDDNSEERISISNDSLFNVRLQWSIVGSSSDAGTIFDFYNSTGKGNGITRSFKWAHPTDSHTYVVRFASPLSRTIRPNNIYGFSEVVLKILGTT